MSFAIQETRSSSKPSKERGKVANWILWPAFLAMFCGAFMFAGAGLVYAAFYNSPDTAPHLGGGFIFGMAAFGLGFAGLITIWIKSVSFDASPETSETTRIPIPMTPQETTKQKMGGNANIPIPSTDAHIVEWGAHKMTFSNTQMRHLADRYYEKGTDYRITRDDKHGKKVFADWHFTKNVMIGAEYWVDDNGAIKWTDDGGEWFVSRMRVMNG